MWFAEVLIESSNFFASDACGPRLSLLNPHCSSEATWKIHPEIETDLDPQETKGIAYEPQSHDLVTFTLSGSLAAILETRVSPSGAII